MMPDVRFDTYYRHEDLAGIVQMYAEQYPHLVRVESIGKSFEGRDIWLVMATDFASGPDIEKPALWVDGNIHATELAGSSACLYLIDKLVHACGTNPDITRCLDSRAFYICPRLNPDGAEWVLADKPKLIRSSTRPYPYTDDPLGGLVEEDIDEDGRLLMMRILDPNGAWKICPEEPRLLVRREPTETGGTYYRLLPEGRIENYDGALIPIQPKKEGLDLNRNFPSNWRQEYEQPGAGPYPASEPEVRAVVEFIARHPNLTGAVAFHTYSGVLLRPYTYQGDEKFPAEDLWTYEKIGKKGTELSGYPAASSYHEFRYHPNETISGVFDNWVYDHLGVFAWTVELWSPQREAGIKEYKFLDWYREHPLEEKLKMLKWSDEVLEGQGYVDWYPYGHPELGWVELGGWNSLLAFQNLPPAFLETDLPDLYSFKSLKHKEKCAFHLNYVVTKKRGF
jgi:murein tripeptide amidase MpaA